ncbi:restriction endonuclease subunit R [Sinomonas atrocyanea]|uniref:Restriction endonuclease subunit R n=1 Tax=Sinomonas atrocyanea TaxID=37927 RepID=A0A126ZV21_9MICC|nr:type I restriction endonuclease [Sinomonas atrocyanea]AMM31009.1 restriction endonuclease subunit R [Sinomonas atrocyanea]GEB63252.1 hypothetical protein SAT01_07000 [Sinomonas atrocyanea]GGG69647.1 hypothetical protein GCM10007172_22250 [Sinomonas atrocyanea]
MTALHNEINFEAELCDHLAQNGWEYSTTDEGYDPQLALYPADVRAWLENTQPDEFAKVVNPSAPAAEQEADFGRLLKRLSKVLGEDAEAKEGEGTLNVLRKGFSHESAHFQMSQSKPPTAANLKIVELYQKVRLRVMRQVHYSVSNGHNSLDLVFFLNGLPVATAELKTDFTQSVADAVEQYRTDRLPKDPKTKKIEHLLAFGTRAVVHFAVSNSEVRMTTKLAGKDTYFLPFNMGNDGRAGNPINPTGSRTSYLWEQVLERESWLRILHSFMHLLVEKKKDPITKKFKTTRTLLFPRFHQWEAVNQMVAAAADEGPGCRYLVQHSAGSGKTNSIAWLAHRLASLHGAGGKLVFDSVIVVSDRTVLDRQLREAVQQIENTKGLVEAVDNRKQGAKSTQLADLLSKGTRIISVTIQTFPFALKAIQQDKKLAGKTFAIIADEAHSSQSGTAANKLKEVLSPEELAALEDGGEVSIEDVMLAEMATRAEAKNISYFAFTATPKAKTLELFGRPGPDGKPVPFHLYTMEQAIEEGFILDVLKNYTPYDLAYRLSNEAKTAHGDDALVDKKQATKEIVRWVKLHPHSIAQKVQIIVEHFRENVAWRLEGKAKAMVVTGSRKEAVRYKLAMDKYIQSKGYKDVGTLVAFSGKVTDPESAAACPTALAGGSDEFTEANMNHAATGDLAEAFDGDEYQVMLVANKYQTGFDQPLLVAMYVDKRLGGVNTVQTLSRLNRTMRGKDTTFVLDFVNKPDDILADFKPYYRAAELSATTDPNLVHNLRSKLDAVGIYDDEDVERTVQVWFSTAGARNHGLLSASVAPVKDRFNALYDAAQEDGDSEELDRLETFRKDLTSYVNAYNFLSQIINYGQTALEKRAIYYSLLSRELSDDNRHREVVDLSGIELTHYALHAREQQNLGLQGGEQLDPMQESGSGKANEAEYVHMSELISKLNEVFAGSGLSDADQINVINSVIGKASEDEMLQLQADANAAQDFYDSPDLSTALLKVILSAGQQHETGIDWLANTVSQEKLLDLAKAMDLFTHVRERKTQL